MQTINDKIFLVSASAPNINGGSAIEFRQPPSLSAGAVNVVCGKNHVGKTFLLKEIANLCLQSDSRDLATNSRITIKKSGAGPIKILRADLFEMKNKFGRIKTVEAPRDNYHKNRAFYVPLIRLIWQALSEEFSPHLKPGKYAPNRGARYNHDKFPGLIISNQKGFRQKVLEELGDRSPIYLNPVYFRALQEYLDSDIGIVRIDSRVELVFRDGNKYCEFSEWSDGLKALACLEAILSTKEHDLLLIDELENHLHPTFISAALQAIRASGIQAIVTSHHPHLIFSTWADEVIYLERVDSSKRRPSRYSLSATTLETDFSKIAKVYRLFSDQDNLLMKQAAFAREDADIVFFNEFVGSFAFEVVEERVGTPRMDSQTRGLAQLLGPVLSSNRNLRVLDLGAGRGRSFFELKQKFARRSSDASLEWTLWEPNPSHRDVVIEKLSTQNINGVQVLVDRGQILADTYDVVYISNVLHELDIDEFVDVISTAVLAVSSKGLIIISEIYPLLHPEWFAVPYPEQELKDCFREAGLRVTGTKLHFKAGEGYCLALSHGGDFSDFDPDQLKELVENMWLQIKSGLLKDYRDNHSTSPLNLENYSRDIQAVMTIARVSEWEAERQR